MITRGRLIVWVVGLTLGIPASVPALQWMQFKFVKQELDCMTDTNDALLNWLSNVEQGSASRELDNISSNLKSCVKGIDARKGTIEFAMDQYKRHY